MKRRRQGRRCFWHFFLWVCETKLKQIEWKSSQFKLTPIQKLRQIPKKKSFTCLVQVSAATKQRKKVSSRNFLFVYLFILLLLIPCEFVQDVFEIFCDFFEQNFQECFSRLLNRVTGFFISRCLSRFLDIINCVKFSGKKL